jgi:hypothetical protein
LKLFACINRTTKVYEDFSNVPCFDEKEIRQEAAGQNRKTDANQKMTIVTKRMTVKVRVWIVLMTPKSKRVMNTTVNYPEFR